MINNKNGAGLKFRRLYRGCAGAFLAFALGAAATAAEPKASSTTDKAATPACPKGYQLDKSSVNPKTGAFSCQIGDGGEPPTRPMACPKGTQYFTNSNRMIVGCEKF